MSLKVIKLDDSAGSLFYILQSTVPAAQHEAFNTGGYIRLGLTNNIYPWLYYYT